MSLNCKFEYFKELDSTNIYLKNAAKNGAEEGLTVIADTQSCGYGRMGRSFYSPDSTGLYMSILLRPELNAKDSLLITTAAAVAVSDAIDEISGKESTIKWVNDIYIGSKKVCGILCESAIGENPPFLDYCVLGVGVNLYAPENGFPDDISGIAGAIFDSKPKKDIRNELINTIIGNLSLYYDNLLNKNYYNKYREKCFIIGKRVEVIKNSLHFEHTVCDIDDSFRLITKSDSGECFLLDSGEVSIKWNI